MNTRKSEVLSASTRERKTREETEWTYEEPNALDIPDQVMNRMANEGMSLRWMRIHLKGVDDYQNVGKKMAEGWTWVTPEEVPEMAISSVVQENGRYSGTVCRGDLALAKMPTGKLEARKRNAVNAQLENSSDSRMPISNNSRSTVTRGRRPNFQE